jgi:hypothetical protein
VALNQPEIYNQTPKQEVWLLHVACKLRWSRASAERAL